jgi:hypothetical protein
MENSDEDEEIARKRKGMLGKRKEKVEMGKDRLLVRFAKICRVDLQMKKNISGYQNVM